MKQLEANALIFIEARQYYERLAYNAEDLSVRHHLLKIAHTFSKLAEKVAAISKLDNPSTALMLLAENWNQQYSESKTGVSNRPEQSLIEQRLTVEHEHLQLLRECFNLSQSEADKRYIADLLATYFDVIELLKWIATKKEESSVK